MSESRYRSIFRPDLFAGQLVLVTGGGTGLGRCTAHELASLGATVVIGGRRVEPLEQTAGEIAEAGGTCHVVQLDIRDEKVVDETIAGIVSRHGPIAGLVNNAGGQFVAPAEKITPKGWRSVVDLNLNGTFLVSRAAYEHCMGEHGGAIVNMLADIWTGYPGMAHMSAARAGIENMSRTLAIEWARAGVRVNSVAPGAVLSSGLLHYPPEIQQRAADECRVVPASRLGTESEVSAAIVFLLCPASAYITGETIRIDGGAQFHKNRLVQTGHHDRSKPFDGFHLRPDFRGTPFEES